VTESPDALTPLNIAARLSRPAVGNPAAATLASGVANCFPGLEFDHRNLDRRFFPGLVVEFADQPGSQASFGAVVVAVDLDDPLLAELPAGDALRTKLRHVQATMGQDGSAWWVATVGQGGVVVDPTQVKGLPMGSVATWRIVRSLERGAVTLVLRRFAAGGPSQEELTLEGSRRAYLGRSEALDGAYAAGELTQSLCSPWQHDFRDCGCYYWASNHPDIAIEPAPEADQELPPPPGTGWVNWLRARPDRPDAPEFGYYEISERFQELAVVLRDREWTGPYRPRSGRGARPYHSADELASVLHQELAPLEHVLTLEYLYAWSSVRTPEEVAALSDADIGQALPLAFRHDPAAPLDGITDRVAAVAYLRRRLRRDVIFLREQLRATAIAEMRHLSWVNLLLRRLAELGMGPVYVPALGVAEHIPTADPHRTRPRSLRPLVREAVVDFESVEQPSGGLDGRYARVRATLQAREYPDELFDIASRIVDDGVDHYSSFRRMAMIVDVYDQPSPPHLRPGFSLAPPTDPAVAGALDAQRQVLALLHQGYAGDHNRIVEARQMMVGFLEGQLQSAAAAGRGVPLFAYLDSSH